MNDMDDSALFMQWAVDTLQHQHQDPSAAVTHDGMENSAFPFPSLQALRDFSQVLVVAEEPTEVTQSGRSGDTSGCGGISPRPDVEQGGWSTFPNSGGPSAPSSNLPTSWNFSAASSSSSQPGMGGVTLDATAAAILHDCTAPEMVYRPQPTRRASAKSAAGAGPGPASAPYAHGHIMAERKRREKINQRFIELSTVIPGLKKMDKATILTDAVRHVKELQDRVKSLEATGGNGRTIETVVLVRKLCVTTQSDEGSPPRSLFGSGTPARSPLPEIDAKISENNVMVRIHCENGKGIFARVLAEVEELHLRIVHTSVMPFTASTVIITTMAKVEEGFTVKAEELVGRLNSALQQHSSSHRQY